MIKKIFKFIAKHKILAIIILVIIVVIGYTSYKKLSNNTNEPRYVLAAVEKGTLISSISGTGQVSASNQADIKPKVSGEVTAIYVKVGQEVKTGTLIVQIDTSDAARTLRDAETSLETAKLELDKLVAPVDELTLLQAENSLTQAQESKQNAKDNLTKSYDDGFSSITNVFLDLPSIMSGLDGLLFDNTFDRNQDNVDWYANQVVLWENDKSIEYKNDTKSSYDLARRYYDDNFAHYKSVSRFSDTATIETLISETYDTTKLIAEAIKNYSNYIDFVKDILQQHNININSNITTQQSTLNTYTGKTNSHISNLLNIKQSIDNYKKAIIDAETSIKEKTLSLTDIKNGPDDFDVRAKKIAIQQKEDALLTAKQNLADYYIRAVFDGVIVEVNVEKGDSASSGTAIAILVAKQRIAEISLNEVDVARVQVGQKATLTFDAIEGLSITGEVVEIDAIGTVSQGVVTYNVKIGLDTQDERVKPGMSVSAAIITNAKQGVLLVPNAAVKTQGNTNYVQILSNVKILTAAATSTGVVSNIPLQQQTVEIGIANDSMTEIVSGLKEGDIIVVRTATTSSTSSPGSSGSQNRGLFGVPGGGGFGR